MAQVTDMFQTLTAHGAERVYRSLATWLDDLHYHGHVVRVELHMEEEGPDAYQCAVQVQLIRDGMLLMNEFTHPTKEAGTTLINEALNRAMSGSCQ